MGEKLLEVSLGALRYLLVISSHLGRSSGLYGVMYGFFVCIIILGVSWFFHRLVFEQWEREGCNINEWALRRNLLERLNQARFLQVCITASSLPSE